MRPVTPVLPGHEKLIAETVVAKDQEQYNPLPSIIVPGSEGEVLSRWEMSDEEKILLLSGGHVYLSIMTFGGPLQPILLRIATPDMIIDEKRAIELPRENMAVDVTTKAEAPPS